MFVQQCMGVPWSPEQISHAPTVRFPDQPNRQLALEVSCNEFDGHAEPPLAGLLGQGRAAVQGFVPERRNEPDLAVPPSASRG